MRKNVHHGNCVLLATALAAQALTASAATLYVWENSPRTAPPFATWASAARNIQSAIDAASTGDEIVVTNGVYATGGRAIGDGPTNRVAVNKAITVRSVNGPDATIIEAHQSPVLTDQVRCVYLTSGATLLGFTLTNGAGGAYCESSNPVLSNCVVVGNTAYQGGGVYRGTLLDCRLIQNSATSSGVFPAGGGTCESILIQCLLAGNHASDSGGGMAYGSATDCTFIGNTSAHDGGGAFAATLNNCTVVSNAAAYRGGGVDVGEATNCTIAHNSAQFGGGTFAVILDHCTLANNSAQADGGGAASYASHGDLRYCVVSNNAAGRNGGGVWQCTSDTCLMVNNRADAGLGGGACGSMLFNCVLSNNLACQAGGGAAKSSLSDCRLHDNTAEDGGGAYDCAMVNCVIQENTALENGGGDGGGAFGGTLRRCTLAGNFSNGDGGGAAYSALEACTLTGNVAVDSGGGSVGGTLTNCLLTSNVATNGGGVFLGGLKNCTLVANSASIGGGAKDAYLVNCIAYFNTANSGPNYHSGAGNVLFSCTTPSPASGTGNITNDPVFLDAAAGNYHLAIESPCIDAGTNLGPLVSFDLNGLPRPLDGNRDSIAAFDMGAYEFNPLFFTSITKVGNNTRLCWFDTVAGMQLQTALSLADPVWTNVPFVPGTNGVELPSVGNAFFRLLIR